MPTTNKSERQQALEYFTQHRNSQELLLNSEITITIQEESDKLAEQRVEKIHAIINKIDDYTKTAFSDCLVDNDFPITIHWLPHDAYYMHDFYLNEYKLNEYKSSKLAIDKFNKLKIWLNYCLLKIGLIENLDIYGLNDSYATSQDSNNLAELLISDIEKIHADYETILKNLL